MDINQETLAAVTRAYRLEFNKGFNGAKPLWKNITSVFQSTGSETVYPFLGDSYEIREWLGDRVVQSLKAHDYRVKNKAFEATVQINRDVFEDDQYALFSLSMQQMGAKAALYPDKLVFETLINGTTGLCYDGLPFFSASHPVGATTHSNLTTGLSNSPFYLIDASQPLKPIVFQERTKSKFISYTDPKDNNVFYKRQFIFGVEFRCNAGYGLWQTAYRCNDVLSQDTFNAAYNQMSATKSDTGETLGITPTHLLVGKSNRVKAFEVVQAQKLADMMDNPNYKIVEVVICDRLP